MYLTFSNLNSIHWIIKKKDIGLYVLFRTFHDNFQVKFSSNNKTLNARLLARVITGCHYT